MKFHVSSARKLSTCAETASHGGERACSGMAAFPFASQRSLLRTMQQPAARLYFLLSVEAQCLAEGRLLKLGFIPPHWCSVGGGIRRHQELPDGIPCQVCIGTGSVGYTVFRNLVFLETILQSNLQTLSVHTMSLYSLYVRGVRLNSNKTFGHAVGYSVQWVKGRSIGDWMTSVPLEWLLAGCPAPLQPMWTRILWNYNPARHHTSKTSQSATGTSRRPRGLSDKCHARPTLVCLMCVLEQQTCCFC